MKTFELILFKNLKGAVIPGFALFPDLLLSCLSPLIISNMLKANFHNKTQALKTPKSHNRKTNQPPESCS